MAETTTEPTQLAPPSTTPTKKKAPNTFFNKKEEAEKEKYKAEADNWVVMTLSSKDGPTVHALAPPVNAPMVAARYAKEYLGVKVEYQKKGNAVVNALEARIAELEAELATKGKKK